MPSSDKNVKDRHLAGNGEDGLKNIWCTKTFVAGTIATFGRRYGDVMIYQVKRLVANLSEMRC